MAQLKWRQIQIYEALAKSGRKQIRMIVPLRQKQAAPFTQPLQVLPLLLAALRKWPLPDHQAVGADAVVEAEGSLMDPAIHPKGLQRRKGFSDAYLIVGPWAVYQNLDLQRPIGQHGVPDINRP